MHFNAFQFNIIMCFILPPLRLEHLECNSSGVTAQVVSNFLQI